MRGGRAPGRLGAADKRPAARTLGQDSGSRESAAPSLWTRGGDTPISSPERAGLPRLRLLATPPGQGELGGGQPGPPPPRTPRPPPDPPPARSRTSLEPVPYTAKRGEGQGPPDTAALRHEPPPPARDPGQGRGAYFLYLAGLDPILSRGGLQSPPSIHFPGPIGSGLGSPFLCSLYLCPALCRLCLTCLSFTICLSFLCPVVSSPSALPFLVQSPHLSRLPLPYTFSRAGPTGRTRLSPIPK